MDIENPASTPDAEPQSDTAAAWDELVSAAPDAPDETGTAAPIESESTRARDELGRFTKAEQDAAAAAAKAIETVPAAAVPPAEQQAPIEQQAPNAAAVVAPPPGWSIAAKAEFDRLPPAVREAVAKREQEVNQGFAKLQEYKGLDPYVDMAKRSGTTITQALEGYTRAEQVLSTDFVSGVRDLCRYYNFSPAQLVEALGGQVQQGYQQPAAQDPYAPVVQKLSALEQKWAQYEQQQAMQEEQAVSSQLHEFASDPANRFFENVRADMGRLITAGMASDLKDAYDKACWAHPEIRELRIKEAQQPALQQRAQAVNKAISASKSIPNGVPTPGAKPPARQFNTTRSAIEAAWDDLAGQM